MTLNVQPLFGLPSRPWPAFRPVNDQVRGGSSTSHFSVSQRSHSAVFSGNLDTSTLGGAGFASQCTTFHPRLSFPSPPFDGLALVVKRPYTLPPNQPTSFVISIKNDKPELREDGRRESVVSYEFAFDLAALPVGDEVEVRAEWGDFHATYRGREDKEAKPLDPASIYELSWMCRSNFDQQKGKFALEILRLGIIRSTKADSIWTSIWRWITLGGLWSRIARWWRGDRGIRLPD
ncbi:CIA30-domain-containing protein [Meredithblackwellia eburnea MCA 4105]